MRTLIILSALILCAVFNSCERKYTPKRAFIVGKTDDDNWSISANIECDSVNMVSQTHAVYWVDGNRFNLYAKSYIKIASNPYFKNN